MMTKHTMPKVCMGRRVYQTGLLSSVSFQRWISVSRKMKSNTNRTIMAAIIFMG